MIQFDPNVSSVLRPGSLSPAQTGGAAPKADFNRTIQAMGDYISQVDDVQQASDASIADLLSGKNNDITSVVSAAAKADMSFKLLVGVRNQLIEAYKQTMNMPI